MTGLLDLQHIIDRQVVEHLWAAERYAFRQRFVFGVATPAGAARKSAGTHDPGFAIRMDPAYDSSWLDKHIGNAFVTSGPAPNTLKNRAEALTKLVEAGMIHSTGENLSTTTRPKENIMTVDQARHAGPQDRGAPMTAGHTIAKAVLVDNDAKELYFEGVRFPHYITEEGPQVEIGIDGSRMSQVTITVWTDRVLVLNSLEDDLEWVRELGKQQREEALRERKHFYEKQRYDTIRRQLADKDARRPAQINSLRRFDSRW